MTLLESVTEKISRLPANRQIEVLDFVDFLASRTAVGSQAPRRDPRGVLEGQLPELTLEDFKAARREMSAGFPREF